MSIYTEILEMIENIEKLLDTNNYVNKSKTLKTEQIQNLILNLKMLKDELEILKQEINYEG